MTGLTLSSLFRQTRGLSSFWLGLRVGDRLVLFCVHKISRVNSRNGFSIDGRRERRYPFVRFTVGLLVVCRVDYQCYNNKNLSYGLEKPSFLEKVFRFLKVFLGFLDFSRFRVQIRLDIKFRPRKKLTILYTILSVTSFSINYNKTHKS